MNKYILGIDGMMCGMCEMHVEDSIRKNLKINKVKASHIKNEVVVFAESSYIEKDFHNALDQTGYRITSFNVSGAKKGLLGWK